MTSDLQGLWKPIDTYSGEWPEQVDLWLNISASTASMGWSDAFRVPDAWRKNGKWFHRDRGAERELDAAYITHWSLPLPPPTEREPQSHPVPVPM